MQQNQLIILVALLAVVVIAIVAALLLMGGPAPQDGMTPPVNPPAIPAAPMDPADALAAGKPVVCQITYTQEGVTMTSTAKIEGKKANVVMDAMGMEMIMISDGVNAYMQSPMFGDDWFMYTAEDAAFEMPTAEEIRTNLENLPEGTTMDCQIVSDIPDSEFQLPAGVVPKDISEMYEGMPAGA